jgi:cell division protein FtsQ
MKQRDPDISFSAYVGTDEGPPTDRRLPPMAAPRRRPAQAEKPVRKSSRVRLLLLTLLLVASLSALYMQRADDVVEYVNRPIASVRMETPLHRVSEMDVRSILAMHLGEGFFGLNAAGLKQQLEAHPWIEKATVRRVWPDSLAVAIHEETAIARWGDDRLLNQYATVFRPEAIDETMSLPLLRGPDGMQLQMMEQYQIFNQMLMTSGLRIRELSMNDRGSWSVMVEGGLLINIGREQVMERLQRFITFYDRHMHKEFENLSSVDLRYRNGISVRRKEKLTGGVASI